MRFFSKVAGSSYTFPDGTKAVFAHGFLDIDERNFPGVVVSPNPQFRLKDDGRPRHIAYKEELLQLAQEGNPLIFTQETVKLLQKVGEEYKVAATQAAKSEMEIARQDQTMRAAGVKGTETGDINKAGMTTTDPNASTVDPALQRTIFAPRMGPGAEALSKAEQLRQEAAARMNQNGQQ